MVGVGITAMENRSAMPQALCPRALVSYLVLTLVLAPSVWAERGGVTYSKRYVCSTVAQVITINLNDLDVKLSPVMASRGVGASESFASIIHRTLTDIPAVQMTRQKNHLKWVSICAPSRQRKSTYLLRKGRSLHLRHDILRNFVGHHLCFHVQR